MTNQCPSVRLSVCQVQHPPPTVVFLAKVPLPAAWFPRCGGQCGQSGQQFLVPRRVELRLLPPTTIHCPLCPSVRTVHPPPPWFILLQQALEAQTDWTGCGSCLILPVSPGDQLHRACPVCPPTVVVGAGAAPAPQSTGQLRSVDAGKPASRQPSSFNSTPR
jgi:hypothetical protein